MAKKAYRSAFTIIGALCGVGIFFIIRNVLDIVVGEKKLSFPLEIAILVTCIIITALIFYLISPMIRKSIERVAHEVDNAVQKMSSQEFIFGTIGLVIGIFLGFLISQLWTNLEIPVLGTVLSILCYLFFGYLGLHLGAKRAGDLAAGFRSALGGRQAPSRPSKKKTVQNPAMPKVLDTSVIIDGRIADIVKTGFIEGKIVIPEFVLVELRHIADSSDVLKRNRGRRGLDILNRMQDQFGIEIYDTAAEKSIQEIPEVDVKLLELASIMHGAVVTNDYNLNKVASIKGVPVLNINDLANTLKPVVLPGEEMRLTPVKEGKEPGQAVAYLDDGTMIVVEDGREFIGEDIPVLVSSVLQTSAGRMIFAKPKRRR